MKIATLVPFKAALLAASITTIGLVALDRLDTEVENYGVPVPDEPFTGCRLEPARPITPEPPRPPEPTIDDHVAPGATVSL